MGGKVTRRNTLNGALKHYGRSVDRMVCVLREGGGWRIAATAANRVGLSV